MIFWWTLGRSKKTKELARTRFEKAADTAYDPDFFKKAGIPDTIDGRFQILGLFVALELKKSDDKKDNQALFDHFFMNCEMAMREMGVGDVGIPKKLHKMMNAFHGHAKTYYDCMDTGDWDDVLTRNVFGNEDKKPTKAQLKTMINQANNYMKDNRYDEQHVA